MGRAESLAAHHQEPGEAVFAGGSFNSVVRHLLEGAQVCAPGGGEIAESRVVWALDEVQRFNRLGNDEIDVCVTLAVAVGAHVDWHAVDPGGEVRPVIQIESAQEHLVRFARAAVLGDDHAGYGLEHVAGSQQRSQRQIHLPHHAFGGSACLPHQDIAPALHQHFLQRGVGLAQGSTAGGQAGT